MLKRLQPKLTEKIHFCFFAGRELNVSAGSATLS
jgi:hypothetical protein